MTPRRTIVLPLQSEGHRRTGGRRAGWPAKSHRRASPVRSGWCFPLGQPTVPPSTAALGGGTSRKVDAIPDPVQRELNILYRY